MYPPFPSEFITAEEPDPNKPTLYLCVDCQVYGIGFSCWNCDTTDIVRNPQSRGAPATPSTMAQALHWALGG